MTGLSGCHLEDQVNPKRCGHLDGKAVVETVEMVKRLRAAVSGRRDENFRHLRPHRRACD